MRSYLDTSKSDEALQMSKEIGRSMLHIKSQIFLVWVLSLLFLAPGIEHLGLSWSFSSKESACNARDAGDAGSIPGLGKSPGRGHGNTLQYSCLENPVDRGAWQVTVHRVAKSQTWLKQLSKHAHILNTSLSLSPNFLGLYNRAGTTFKRVIMITQDFAHTGKATTPVLEPSFTVFLCAIFTTSLQAT